MIKKIIHVADIHIRNIQRHSEYNEQINKFIEQCEEISTEYEFNEVRIVIVGDLFHQKIQTSNEQTTLLSDFLKKLNKIAPVVIIAGNHDFMESNMDRLDSITPIIKLLELENVNYLDMSCDYKSKCFVDDNIVWCLYSLFDNYKIPEIKTERIDNPDKKFIGLFHGAVAGSKTDIGFEFEHGMSLDIFDGLDACLCGDIHKRQELNHGDIKIVMPGSLIQQNKGETISGHGYLLWDVDSLDYEPYDLESDYGFYNFKINSITDIENGEEEFINF